MPGGWESSCTVTNWYQDHIPAGIVSRSQIQKLERVVKFSTFVLNDWWFNCPVATSAPRQDLGLMANINQYKKIDERLAKSAETAIRMHTWYLTGEMVPLALWNENFVEDELRSLADTLIISLPETSCFTGV